MCDLNGPFKLCSCGKSEVDRTKPHWILHRFLENKTDLHVVGEFSNPNLYERYIIKKIKKRLNTYNVFDFEYIPDEGGYLELFCKIYSDEYSDENEPDFRLEYIKGKWVELEEHEISEYRHKTKFDGKIDGPLTELTSAYKNFMGNSSEEIVSDFLEQTNFWKTPQVSITKNNLMKIFTYGNYGIYKCYKGEVDNPFKSDKDELRFKFWWIESVFEKEFYQRYSISKWDEFFKHGSYSNNFRGLLDKHQLLPHNLQTKKQLLELFLKQSAEHYGFKMESYLSLKSIGFINDFEVYSPIEINTTIHGNSDFSMYGYYKGESENPFGVSSEDIKNMFWKYESIFESKYRAGHFTPQNFQKSGNDNRDNEWLRLINDRPNDKEEIFKLWCFELLFEYLPVKGGLTGSQYCDMYFEKT
ncbi:hypothetical protein [Aquirufa aurantiipilula]